MKTIAFIILLCGSLLAQVTNPNGTTTNYNTIINNFTNCTNGLGFLSSNGTCNPNVPTINGYVSQTNAFLSRLATPPTLAQAQAYNALISGLASAGVWAKLDGLFIFAAPSSAYALQNLVQPGTATANGSPSFLANGGYTGTTTSDYIDSTYNPTTATASPNYTQNYGNLFAWRNVSPVGDSGFIASLPSGSNTTYLLEAYNSNPAFRLNSTTSANSATFAVNTGLFEVSRLSNASLQGYQSGVPLGALQTASTTSAVSNNTFIALNYLKSAGSETTGQIAAFGFGGGLTPNDSLNLNNYLSQYLATIAGSSTLGLPLYTSTITSNGSVSAGTFQFGVGVARLFDGRLLSIFGQNTGVLNVSGNIQYSLSSNNGVTWTTPVVFATPPSGFSYTDCAAITVLNSGTIALSCTETPAPDIVLVWIGTVTPNGPISFAAPISLTSSLTSPTTGSAIVPLANGALMLPMYSNTNENQGITVQFSTNSGTTWGNETTVITQAITGNSDLWGESNFVQQPGGLCYGILRNDNSVNTGRTGWWWLQSTNTACTTWSTSPTQIINTPQPARAALVEDAYGNLFACGRFTTTTTNQTGCMYSTNSGTTWSAVAGIDSVGSTGYGHFYSQGIWDSITQSFLYAIGLCYPTASCATGGGTQVQFQQFSPIYSLTNPGTLPTAAGFTYANMATQSSATLTPITGMSWPLTANKSYNLNCPAIPVTLASTGTLAFGLVGPGTPISYNLDFYGMVGASGIAGDFNILAQTTWVSTKTGATSALAATVVAHVVAQIQNGATAGTLTLDTSNVAGTGTIQVLAGAVCIMEQVN